MACVSSSRERAAAVAQPMFEFGEELLDWVQIRGIFGQEEQILLQRNG